MRRESPLPIQFQSLTGKVRFVIQRGKNEWSSSCPSCGGDIHPDGKTWPDRFRLWPVSSHGLALGWCRHCSYVWTEKNERQPSREDIERWRLEQIRIETERKQAAERALELLNSEHLWERFNAAATQYSRQVGRSWGLSDDWQEYLKFGFIPDYSVYKGKDIQPYHSPTITMPVWWAKSKVQNIKLRVLDPKDDNDRYRNWYKTGEHYLYMPLHDVEFDGGGVILVEGEKKAAVAEAYNPTSHRVIGMQSIKPDPDLFSLIADCEPIIIIPDPDAFICKPNAESGVDYLVRNIGRERVRIVRLPVKLDDGIVKHDLNFANYIKMAVRPR
jgi:hypothetical protein